MEYYLYISNSKVDMLLPQIPQQLKTSLAAEIGVNVGVFSAKFKAEHDLGSKEDRVSRLKAVTKFLEKTEKVGSVDQPEAWIAGTQSVRIVYPDEHRNAVFFSGRSSAGTRFALGGSSAHLLSRGKADNVEIGWSFLPDLMSALNSMITAFEKQIASDATADRIFQITTKGSEFEWVDLVTALEKDASGPSMNVSFLAKKLLVSKHPYSGHTAVLATPLYVTVE